MSNHATYPNPVIKNVRFVAPDVSEDAFEALQQMNPELCFMRLNDTAVWMPSQSLATH